METLLRAGEDGNSTCQCFFVQPAIAKEWILCLPRRLICLTNCFFGQHNWFIHQTPLTCPVLLNWFLHLLNWFFKLPNWFFTLLNWFLHLSKWFTHLPNWVFHLSWFYLIPAFLHPLLFLPTTRLLHATQLILVHLTDSSTYLIDSSIYPIDSSVSPISATASFLILTLQSTWFLHLPKRGLTLADATLPAV